MTREDRILFQELSRENASLRDSIRRALAVADPLLNGPSTEKLREVRVILTATLRPKGEPDGW